MARTSITGAANQLHQLRCKRSWYYGGMDRLFQAIMIAATIAFSWYGMMAVHELGHLINAYVSGGAVRQVVLPVLGFSRTDMSVNPRPMWTAWGGAMWGVILPLMLLGAMQAVGKRYAFVARFFAGFCLIANGAYLAGGAWANAGDAADLVNHGASQWQLYAFGLPAVALGLGLLNGLGPNFGLGQTHGKVDRRAAIVAAAACLATVPCYLLVGWLQAQG